MSPKKTKTTKATAKPATKAKSVAVRPVAPSHSPGLERTDLRRMVLELAVQVAPTDIEYALANGPQILKRAAHSGSHLSVAPIQLAIDCLQDYLDGNCPQIPLHTISLLTAALQYLGDQIDLVPDFLPHLGDLDDAAVFAVAMSMARPGVLRYCAATNRRLGR